MTIAVFTSRFWKKLLQTTTQHRPQQAPSAAEYTNEWTRLPPELVDEILWYLSDDLPALKACSLTCKIMLGSARPLIGSWLFLSSTRNRKSKARSMKSILKRFKGPPDPFERLVVANRQGLLQCTQHLVIKMGRLQLTPQPLRPYIPYLRSIGRLQTLAIDGLDISAFMPMFDDCFGMFTRSLRALDIGSTRDPESYLLWFITQFPFLEDLSIRSRHAICLYSGVSPPIPRTSPPFRGHLNLSSVVDSRRLCETLAQLPKGLNFTSLELKGCEKPVAIITACQFTLKSVKYTWTSSSGKRYSIHSEGST